MGPDLVVPAVELRVMAGNARSEGYAFPPDGRRELGVVEIGRCFENRVLKTHASRELDVAKVGSPPENGFGKVGTLPESGMPEFYLAAKGGPPKGR